jgi:hypothetical protein
MLGTIYLEGDLGVNGRSRCKWANSVLKKNKLCYKSYLHFSNENPDAYVLCFGASTLVICHFLRMAKEI